MLYALQVKLTNRELTEHVLNFAGPKNQQTRIFPLLERILEVLQEVPVMSYIALV